MSAYGLTDRERSTATIAQRLVVSAHTV